MKRINKEELDKEIEYYINLANKSSGEIYYYATRCIGLLSCLREGVIM